jgi:hypothetical protein
LDSVRNATEVREGHNGHAALGFADGWQVEPGSSKASDSSTFGVASWPVLAEEALHGLPGEVVKAIEPHTEADSVALLVSLLASFGNALGQGAYYKVGPTLHYPKLFVALVGKTSKARKGTSWDPVRELLYEVDPAWVDERVVSGLSSGEGVIHAVRDPSYRNIQGEEVVVDEGEADKRLMVLESELAGPLKVMSREGNTLSVVLREAWDGDRLRTLTKNSPTKATGAHVSVISHVTKEELLRHLNETEQANGFANRFHWLLVKRSKELPFGGDWHEVEMRSLVERLRSAIEFGRSAGEISWGEKSARAAWQGAYGQLSEGKPGLFGAVVGRAEAQVVRLAILYAVMDESHTIELDHLNAALGLWEYAEESARYIFGDATGDPVADQIAEALRAAGQDGLTRTETRDLFKRHKSADRIDRALNLLLNTGRARRTSEDTGGRPTERWFPT